MNRKLFSVSLLAVAVLFAPACTNKEGESESPVVIRVDLQQQLLAVNPCAPPAFGVQAPTIVLSSSLKNASQSDPQGFANVQMSNYQVQFRRLDGGTRVPQEQNFSAGVVVPSGGSSTLRGFPIMTTGAVTGSPFDQLLPFNGGIDRETGKNEIQIQYLVTFFGRTVSGHRVQSQTASADLIFRCLQ